MQRRSSNNFLAGVVLRFTYGPSITHIMRYKVSPEEQSSSETNQDKPKRRSTTT